MRSLSDAEAEAQWFQEMQECTCGSNLIRSSLYDARGIFCCYICDACEDKKKATYRPEIFTDSQYECDERIGDDY